MPLTDPSIILAGGSKGGEQAEQGNGRMRGDENRMVCEWSERREEKRGVPGFMGPFTHSRTQHKASRRGASATLQLY